MHTTAQLQHEAKPHSALISHFERIPTVRLDTGPDRTRPKEMSMDLHATYGDEFMGIAMPFWILTRMYIIQSGHWKQIR